MTRPSHQNRPGRPGLRREVERFDRRPLRVVLLIVAASIAASAGAAMALTP